MSRVPRQFRLTVEMAKYGCQYEKYSDKSKYPYLNFLPFTAPSQEAQKYDITKQNRGLDCNNFDLHKWRTSCTTSDKLFPIEDKLNCASKREKINGITCDWIEYAGSSLKNGVIIQLHSGGFTLSSHIKLFAQSELLSKLTGMVCLCVDYSLAPEYVLPTQTNEVVSIYKYLIDKKGLDPSTEIFIVGGSAGGGLTLLTIQKILELGLKQPCGVWMDSPMTDLSYDHTVNDKTWSKVRNMDTDISCGNGNWLFKSGEMAVGNIDKNHKKIGDFSLKDSKYSGLYGEFKGLCPMYFTVCATEILYDDTILAAEKAYNNNIDVRVDIAPFMLHGFPMKCNILPEGYVQTCIGADWIMNQQRKAKKARQNRL